MVIGYYDSECIKLSDSYEQFEKLYQRNPHPTAEGVTLRLASASAAHAAAVPPVFTVHGVFTAPWILPPPASAVPAAPIAIPGMAAAVTVMTIVLPAAALCSPVVPSATAAAAAAGIEPDALAAPRGLVRRLCCISVTAAGSLSVNIPVIAAAAAAAAVLSSFTATPIPAGRSAAAAAAVPAVISLRGGTLTAAAKGAAKAGALPWAPHLRTVCPELLHGKTSNDATTWHPGE